jgi:hypothetical protein
VVMSSPPDKSFINASNFAAPALPPQNVSDDMPITIAVSRLLRERGVRLAHIVRARCHNILNCIANLAAQVDHKLVKLLVAVQYWVSDEDASAVPGDAGHKHLPILCLDRNIGRRQDDRKRAAWREVVVRHLFGQRVQMLLI